MPKKLVREMTEEEHEAYKRDLKEKKEKLKNMTPEEKEEYLKKRQAQWNADFIKRKYEMVNFRTPKGGKDIIKEFAAQQGITMNDFLRKMVYKGMKEEGFDFDDNLIFPETVRPDDL